jgi:glutathione peroxidase
MSTLAEAGKVGHIEPADVDLHAVAGAPIMGDVTLNDIALTTLDGRGTSLADFDGKAVLIVNVASRCGLTPQYGKLEELQKTFGERGFTVLGVPCNQFNGQEPGTAEEILDFCSATYGVTFPMLEKADVNGADRHPLYKTLTAVADAEGVAGDVQWNFEKFLLSPTGEVTRFRPRTEPDAPEIVSAITAALPA